METYRTWQAFLQSEFKKELEEAKKRREAETKVFEQIRASYKIVKRETCTLTITSEDPCKSK